MLNLKKYNTEKENDQYVSMGMSSVAINLFFYFAALRSLKGVGCYFCIFVYYRAIF